MSNDQQSSDSTPLGPGTESETVLPTGGAPSLPTPKIPGKDETVPYSGSIRSAREVLPIGTRIDDFEVESVLGRGAFGTVYLARQLSLDRQVALKIAANEGSEGRTMARLEHQHIVQVFSESVDPTGMMRLLCMQLVPGAPLDKLIRDLADIRLEKGTWTGQDLLDATNQRTKLTEVFDAHALREREVLANMDALEATCWFVSRLAQAVDYAHKQGVLHRDIKPANVLVNCYGQPLLADFNISFQSLDTDTSAEDRFGGTLLYMAPEHLDACHPRTATPPEAVTARSDIYALGLLLYELLQGESPLEKVEGEDDRLRLIERLKESRLESAPDVEPGVGDAAKAFSYIVRTCLEPNPEERFATGKELAEALEGCRQLRAHERATKSEWPLVRIIQQRPIWCVVWFALFPQFLGSVFNISYNVLEILPKLTEVQQSLFQKLVLGYNLFAYPLAVAVGAAVILPLVKVWRELKSKQPVAEERLAWGRGRALQMPLWLLAVAALGWLPGGLFFPWALDMWAGPLPRELYGHFFASFSISGLIAVAYSLGGVQYASIRGLYVQMWPRAQAFRETAGRELGQTRWLSWLMIVLAGTIPSFALVGLLNAFPWRGDDVYFRLLISMLSLLGTAGIFATLPIANRISRYIDSLME